MVTPVLERFAPPPADPDAPPPKPTPWRLMLFASLALAALSLTLPTVATYDPLAWLIWGREIAHFDLVTTTGPSWKPLPVLFTIPFSFAGDDAAPRLWVMVARAGGILAYFMAYRLGARLAGPVAGVIACISLILADDFLRQFARGNSEGILVAVSLWAIERHLDGRRRDAFLLGLAAALLRPEVWPFIALYGLYLIAVDRRTRTVALVLGGGLALAILWFVPEYLGSGDFLRAANRARQPNPDSAAFAEIPFLEVFARSASMLAPLVYAGGVIAVLYALRDRGGKGIALAMAAVSTVLMISVAAMTQAGFAGNLRYIALPAAFVCVLAGAGWVWLTKTVRRRFGARAATALVALVAAAWAPFAISDVKELDEAGRDIADEADLTLTLPAAIEKAGGREALKKCGSVYTGNFQTQAVAWYMHLHAMEVEIFAFPPGTTIAASYTSLSRDPRFPQVTRTRRWVIGSSCRASEPTRSVSGAG